MLEFFSWIFTAQVLVADISGQQGESKVHLWIKAIGREIQTVRKETKLNLARGLVLCFVFFFKLIFIVLILYRVIY